MSSHRPTIQEIVPGYVACGIAPAKAVKYVVDSRLSARNGHGKGSRAVRRQLAQERQRWDKAVAECKATGKRIQGMIDRQKADRLRRIADELADLETETRIHLPTHINLHDE